MNAVTTEQARDFYRAAASFYREAPWRSVAEGETIKIKCAQLEGGPWYAVVLGRKRGVRGLMLFDDRLNPPSASERQGDDEAAADRMRNIAVQYEHRRQVSPDALEAINQHRFEVAGPGAYPQPFRMETGRRFRAPRAWELELLEACLWVIPDFLKRAEDRSPDVLVYAFNGMIGRMTFDLSWVPKGH
jgi:hypothetical protein